MCTLTSDLYSCLDVELFRYLVSRTQNSSPAYPLPLTCLPTAPHLLTHCPSLAYTLPLTCLHTATHSPLTHRRAEGQALTVFRHCHSLTTHSPLTHHSLTGELKDRRSLCLEMAEIAMHTKKICHPQRRNAVIQVNIPLLALY